MHLGGEVFDVNAAVAVDVDGLHAHARHLRRRGVGAVRRRGDEAHVAVALSYAFQVRHDGAQPCVLPLRTAAEFGIMFYLKLCFKRYFS